jgi:hypothetical protein
MRLTGQAMGYKMAINTHTSLRRVMIFSITTTKHTHTHTNTHSRIAHQTRLAPMKRP